jgi:hypothetical protein
MRRCPRCRSIKFVVNQNRPRKFVVDQKRPRKIYVLLSGLWRLGNVAVASPLDDGSCRSTMARPDGGSFRLRRWLFAPAMAAAIPACHHVGGFDPFGPLTLQSLRCFRSCGRSVDGSMADDQSPVLAPPSGVVSHRFSVWFPGIWLRLQSSLKDVR